MAQSFEERAERQLQEFEQKRDSFEREIVQTVDDIKSLMDKILKGITDELTPQVEQTDTVLEEYTRDFKRMANRRNELLRYREQLRPLLEMFGMGRPTPSSTPIM